MNLKICSKCNKEKPLTEFYYRKNGPRKGKYYEKCKECMKDRGRKYYHKNIKRQLKLALIRRNRYRKNIRDFLDSIKNHPCMDCNNTYPPCVMDFDHRNSNEKEKEVARMVAGGWSRDNIIKEIKKCDLVCANCHRIRTFRRNNKLR